MDNFYIISNKVKDHENITANRVKAFLEAHGKHCTIMQDELTFSNAAVSKPVDPPENTDCIISIGGDGTLLKVARDTNERQIPIIGVDLGAIGYLTEIDHLNPEPALEKLISGECKIRKRMMLYGKVRHGDKVIASDSALNDIVINRGGNPKMIDMNIFVNEHLLYSIRGDGIIISTPTGSTGYSLSAGGPVVSPEASMFILTPLSPHSLSSRSIILPNDVIIRMTLGPDKNGSSTSATVTFDGDTCVQISTGDSVEIKKSNKDTLMAVAQSSNFIEVLYHKMNPLKQTEERK